MHSGDDTKWYHCSTEINDLSCQFVSLAFFFATRTVVSPVCIYLKGSALVVAPAPAETD